MFVCKPCAEPYAAWSMTRSFGICEMCGKGPRACSDVPPHRLTSTTEPVAPEIRCDCSTCRPGRSCVGVGNPPHGWFRLAQYILATREDRYVWCCSWCHVLIYDINDQDWMYLRSHEYPFCAGRTS